MTRELENIVESIIFASPEGASTKEITRCIRGAVATAREADAENAPEEITRFADVDEERVNAAIGQLNAIYEETGRAFVLVQRPAGWRIMSRADFAPWVRELFPDKKPARLSPGALETLAIIAYRQPITRASIEAVRGVGVDGPIQALLDRNVIRIAGRADLPGRPLLYETTDLFLEHFGIQKVDDLPNASELRNVKLPEPEPPAPSDTQSELPLEGAEGEAPAKPKKKGRGKKGKAAAAEAEAAPAAPGEGDAPPAEEAAPVDGEAAPAADDPAPADAAESTPEDSAAPEEPGEPGSAADAPEAGPEAGNDDPEPSGEAEAGQASEADTEPAAEEPATEEEDSPAEH